MSYLDVQIELAHGKFHTQPYSKPTELCVPKLSNVSAHFSKIHVSWPRALLRRRLELCMMEKDRLETVSLFNAKLIYSGLPPINLQDLVDNQKK